MLYKSNPVSKEGYFLLRLYVTRRLEYKRAVDFCAFIYSFTRSLFISFAYNCRHFNIFVFMTFDPEIFAHFKISGQRLQHSGIAHPCGEKLLRSWVRLLMGAGLFSCLSFPQQWSLIRFLMEVQHYCFSFTKIDAQLGAKQT